MPSTVARQGSSTHTIVTLSVAPSLCDVRPESLALGAVVSTTAGGA